MIQYPVYCSAEEYWGEDAALTEVTVQATTNSTIVEINGLILILICSVLSMVIGKRNAVNFYLFCIVL